MMRLIRDPRPEVQAVLIAAWQANNGEHEAAQMLLAELAPGRTGSVDRTFDRLRVELGEVADLTQRMRLCADDPKAYIDLYEDSWTPGSLIEYSEWRRERLEDEINAAVADARRNAESIAEWADSGVAA